MSERKNRFGFESVDGIAMGASPRRRGGGPMSAAVRETAESVQESTEAKIEARRQNAEDARAFRTAVDEGRVLSRLELEQVHTDDLPRDRLNLDAVARSDEMDELKASILVHGQKEPIEVYRDVAGSLQLKKGWRRLTALTALLEETGDERFSTVLARVDLDENVDRLRHYVDMVEENILREDLTFAEMAHVAIEAAADRGIEGSAAEDLVTPLYSSLHKTKRSYVRAFVTLMQLLGDDLRFPKAVSRDLGVKLVRELKAGTIDVGLLKSDLRACLDVEAQMTVLQSAMFRNVESAPSKRSDTRQKYEFHVGTAKVTARKGEFRIKDSTDFTDIPRERLEKAVAAFRRALSEV